MYNDVDKFLFHMLIASSLLLYDIIISYENTKNLFPVTVGFFCCVCVK